LLDAFLNLALLGRERLRLTQPGGSLWGDLRDSGRGGRESCIKGETAHSANSLLLATSTVVSSVRICEHATLGGKGTD
jgi:hypothetical protein